MIVIMEVSDICFCIVHNGKEYNKWEVRTTEIMPSGTICTFYYFDTKEDAEAYRTFLIYQECIDVASHQIGKRYSYNKEREEWRQLIESVNIEQIKDKVSGITPVIEKRLTRCVN